MGTQSNSIGLKDNIIHGFNLAFRSPEVKRETITTEISAPVQEYEITIHYDDDEETERATQVEFVNGNVLKFGDVEPSIVKHGNNTEGYYPGINVNNWIDAIDHTMVSIPETRKIEIEKYQRWIIGIPDVEYTQVYHRYGENGEWWEHHTEFEKDDEYEFTWYYPSEWDQVISE